MDHIICSRKAKMEGKKCTLLRGGSSLLSKPKTIGRRPITCIDARRCISMSECCHQYSTKLARTAEMTKPWWNRCPVSEANTFRAMTKLAKTEGLPTLWSGLPATIIMALPSTVLYFTAYEQLKTAFRNLSDSSNRPASQAALLSSFAAGCTARLISTTCIAPLELIRTRMQVDGSSLTHVARQLRANINSTGLGPLYLGYSATILRDVPFSGIYFCAFETNKIMLKRNEIMTHSPNGFNCLAASGAAMIAGLLTNPFDVIKTRQQMMLGSTLSKPLSLHKTYVKIVSQGTDF